MTKQKPDADHLEVAHLSGPEGIRAAFEVLCGSRKGTAESGGADSAQAASASSDKPETGGKAGALKSAAKDGEGGLPTALEEVPRIRWTCQKCAAENDGDCEICWNCNARRG